MSVLEAQELTTHAGASAKAFQLNGQPHLAVANTNGNNVQLYRSNGVSFEAIQSLSVNTPVAADVLVNSDSSTYLIVASQSVSKVFLYDSDQGAFVAQESMDLDTPFATDVKVIPKEETGIDYTFVAFSIYKAVEPEIENYEAESAIYYWSPFGSLVPLQTILTTGAAKIEYFTSDGSLYVIFGNQAAYRYNLILEQPLKYEDIESPVYKFEGMGFVKTSGGSVRATGLTDLKTFTGEDGTMYLAVSQGLDRLPESSGVDGTNAVAITTLGNGVLLYEWLPQLEVFDLIQTYNVFAPSALGVFYGSGNNDDSAPFLVVTTRVSEQDPTNCNSESFVLFQGTASQNLFQGASFSTHSAVDVELVSINGVTFAVVISEQAQDTLVPELLTETESTVGPTQSSVFVVTRQGPDFTPRSGTVTFPSTATPGETSISIPVMITNTGNDAEVDEFFEVTISPAGASAASAADTDVTVTVVIQGDVNSTLDVEYTNGIEVINNQIYVTEEEQLVPFQLASFSLASGAPDVASCQIQGTVASNFAITGGNTLVVEAPLDREAAPLGSGYRHVINVLCQGITNPQNAGTAYVVVNVNDINDNPPVFPISKAGRDFDDYIYEHQEPGQVLRTMEVTDVDATPLNVTFSITDITTAEEQDGYTGPTPFVIDSVTGVITTAVSFDRDTGPKRFFFFVVATDAEKPSFSAMVEGSLTIEDLNDNAPIFTQDSYRVVIPESFDTTTSSVPAIVPGTRYEDVIFSEISASDADEGDNALVSYSFLESTSFFLIDDETAELIAISRIDYEAQDGEQRLFNFTVQACDAGQVTANNPYGQQCTTVPVTIVVEDLNDNAPQLTSISLLDSSLVEEAQPTTASTKYFQGPAAPRDYLRFLATDADTAGGNAQISFSLQNGSNAAFDMSADGVLSLATELAPGSYSITLDMDDAGSPQQKTTEQASVVVLDRIALAGPAAVSVSEAATTSDVLGTFTADVTVNSFQPALLAFSIQDGPDSSAFTIGQSSGELKLAQALDYESDSHTYTITVVVTDTASSVRAVSTQAVTITLTDENDVTPVITPPAEIVDLVEDDALATGPFASRDLASLQVTDPDTNTVLAFSIHSAAAVRRSDGTEQAVTSMFQISNTGVISNAQPIDGEQYVSFSVVARVFDGVNEAMTTLDISSVANVNDVEPAFLQPSYEVVMSETAPLNASVTTVGAQDGDFEQGSQLSYTIQFEPAAPATEGTTENGGSGPFVIDATTGEITLAAPLNFEAFSEHRFTVEVSDGRSTDTATVRVQVTNTNEVAPEIDDIAEPILLSEDSPVGTVVATVTANDQDRGDSVFFSLSTFTDTFAINATSGEIVTTSALDREQKDSYSVVVRASDRPGPNQGLASTSTVTVTITDVNDETPEITYSNVLAVTENAPAGTMVAEIRASDRDINENGRLSFSLAGADASKLSVNDSGIVTVAGSIDRETQHQLNFTVVVSDNGADVVNHVSLALVAQVLDENDETPYFSGPGESGTLELRVPEDTQVGVEVYKLTASDADATAPNRQLSFSLGGTTAFAIEPATGSIRLATEVDFEVRGPFPYEFTVTVTDGSLTSAPLAVSVAIQDVSDEEHQ